jgi:hypothetical protein
MQEKIFLQITLGQKKICGSDSFQVIIAVSLQTAGWSALIGQWISELLILQKNLHLLCNHQ